MSSISPPVSPKGKFGVKSEADLEKQRLMAPSIEREVRALASPMAL
jgi:hypothetical protein